MTPSISHTTGTADTVDLKLATFATTCDVFPWDAGTGVIDILGALPSGCCYNQSVEAQLTFSLAAGTSQTYFLNAQREFGTASLAAGQLRCTLLN